VKMNGFAVTRAETAAPHACSRDVHCNQRSGGLPAELGTALADSERRPRPHCPLWRRVVSLPLQEVSI